MAGPRLAVLDEMAMLWAEDDTGLLVVAGVARKGKKPKPPKADKKKKSGAMAAERPSMPGLPPAPASVSHARGSLLGPPPQPRPSAPPIGLPIVPAPGTSTGSQTGLHARHRSTSRRGDHKVARALGWVFVFLVVAAGGLAVGALTDVGTQVEAFVLGPPPPSAPALDPRVPALQADLDKTRAELATERKTAEDLRGAAADASPIVDIEGEPANATAPVKKKHHHKHKKTGKIDL